MARRDIENGAPTPLNPRDRNQGSYFLADRDFLSDLSDHMAWIYYEQQKHTPDEG